MFLSRNNSQKPGKNLNLGEFKTLFTTNNTKRKHPVLFLTNCVIFKISR